MTALPRASGVQLHVTSLPSGTLGPDAHAFVDWLAAAGQRFWQVLPLGPPDRHGSPYKSASAFAAWRGLLHDPGAEVGDDEVEAFRAQHADWIADWEAHAGGRRAVADQVRFAREWGDLRVHAARRRRPPLSATCRSTSRPGAPTIAPTPSSSATTRSRACRPTPTPTRGSCGATRSTTGRRCSAGATAGGWRDCAARSSWSTSRASTTSARSPPTGPSRPGRGTPAGGAGRADRGVPSSTRRNESSASSRSSPRTSASSRRPCGGCATGSASRAWWCCSSPSTPRTRHGPHWPRNHREHQVLYTGTHDNDTLRGWWDHLDDARRA